MAGPSTGASLATLREVLDRLEEREAAVSRNFKRLQKFHTDLLGLAERLQKKHDTLRDLSLPRHDVEMDSRKQRELEERLSSVADREKRVAEREAQMLLVERRAARSAADLPEPARRRETSDIPVARKLPPVLPASSTYREHPSVSMSDGAFYPYDTSYSPRDASENSVFLQTQRQLLNDLRANDRELRNLQEQLVRSSRRLEEDSISDDSDEHMPIAETSTLIGELSSLRFRKAHTHDARTFLPGVMTQQRTPSPRSRDSLEQGARQHLQLPPGRRERYPTDDDDALRKAAANLQAQADDIALELASLTNRIREIDLTPSTNTTALDSSFLGSIISDGSDSDDLDL